ncbi:hypothetical protein PHYSODRAFT_336797 [Phytophthora sojae]|uniref:Uncharacterized protein n=1 Tax=Phytophthora sojae (strain P6497) TaxID=1094619 RepID=G4ZWE4_PHYSP|nr:hypothetical protein PHYSODRAFT_336797 [Phytophthora sojae]EGZ12372.1 hypothetical protein PHYSODRAFT_336797 [Phytophthora sojae]|eukprot:XP_009532705.1 hypothetical protein PHYSODRAFT_336797 [Phytophthora sojae]
MSHRYSCETSTLGYDANASVELLNPLHPCLAFRALAEELLGIPVLKSTRIHTCCDCFLASMQTTTTTTPGLEGKWRAPNNARTLQQGSRRRAKQLETKKQLDKTTKDEAMRSCSQQQTQKIAPRGPPVAIRSRREAAWSSCRRSRAEDRIERVAPRRRWEWQSSQLKIYQVGDKRGQVTSSSQKKPPSVETLRQEEAIWFKSTAESDGFESLDGFKSPADGSQYTGFESLPSNNGFKSLRGSESLQSSDGFKSLSGFKSLTQSSGSSPDFGGRVVRLGYRLVNSVGRCVLLARGAGGPHVQSVVTAALIVACVFTFTEFVRSCHRRPRKRPRQGPGKAAGRG